MTKGDTSQKMKKRGSKSKIKRMKWVVDFLEEDLTIDSLVSNPQKALEIGKGLRVNFLSREEALSWKKAFFSRTEMRGYRRIAKDPSNIDMAHSIAGGLAKNIYAYYSDLGKIWNEFKRTLKIYRSEIYPFPESFSIKIATIIRFRSDKVELKTGEAYIEPPSGEISISYEHSMRFLSLLEGIPFHRLCECKDCSRWFVSTYGGKQRQKNYCSNRCASRANKNDMRHNPERRKQYEQEKKSQKDRYRKKVLGQSI